MPFATPSMAIYVPRPEGPLLPAMILADQRLRWNRFAASIAFFCNSSLIPR
jgi:hypothetical protein